MRQPRVTAARPGSSASVASATSVTEAGGASDNRVAKRDAATGIELYGNVYSSLLDYVIFAVLIFYVLTIAGIFVLRRKQPAAERPYKAFGYPFVPAAYIVVARFIAFILFAYTTHTSWPGLVIVLAGVPVYFLWRRTAAT